jgi:hypothetical protein
MNMGLRSCRLLESQNTARSRRPHTGGDATTPAADVGDAIVDVITLDAARY